jgi:hypothetical protein
MMQILWMQCIDNFVRHSHLLQWHTANAYNWPTETHWSNHIIRQFAEICQLCILLHVDSMVARVCTCCVLNTALFQSSEEHRNMQHAPQNVGSAWNVWAKCTKAWFLQSGHRKGWKLLKNGKTCLILFPELQELRDLFRMLLQTN